MSGILNKLGLGHSSDSSHSSSSSSSTTSHSTTSHTSATTGATTSATGYNTVNKTGYADGTATTSSYAHTNPGAVTASTTTTTTTTTAGNTGAYGTTGVANTGAAYGTTGTAATAATGDYLTRSEERLLVGKEQVQAGVASLNKYVTSEHVHTAVPITREHVVIEREPITAADNIRNAEIREAHIEVALTEERAVAAKETVAVEKVKLRKEVEHTTQNVDAELRKEHIEFGTTNEATHAKTLGAAPGTAGYTTGTTATTTTTGANIDPVANPRV